MSRPTTPARENWKPIAGYETVYEVSDQGRVKRIGGGSGATAGRIIRGRLNSDGYWRVDLWNSPNPPKTKFVHVLVLEAFVGPCPPGMEACHGDGNSGNAALSNLRWDTPVNNAADREKHGNQVRGERHGMARLTEFDVGQIRAHLRAGEPQGAIAVAFGVRQQTISDIKRGKRWSATV